jgi:hypothetical protein
MENQGLAVQTWQRDDRTNAISSPEIEGDNLVLGHAIKPAVWTKAQAPRLLKPALSFGTRTRTRCPSARSYSRIVVTASAAPNGFSLLTTTLPLGAIARSSGLSSGSLTFHDGSIRRSKSKARIVLSPSPPGPMPDARKQRAIGTKRKTARKWDDMQRQDIFARPVELPRKRHDGALAAQTDIIAAVRPQIAAAWIQSFYASRRAHDLSVAVKCENPVGSAIDKERSVDGVDAKPTRIDDAGIVGEGKNFSIACTVRTGRACDEESHFNLGTRSRA